MNLNTSDQSKRIRKPCRICGGQKRYAGGHCVACVKKRNQKRHQFVRNIYNAQRRNSRHRGHPEPEYDLPWLFQWILDNGFNRLWRAYVSSGYNKQRAPSVDRLNDSIGYTKRNIRLCTWKDNNETAVATRAKATYESLRKPVRRNDGRVFPSLKEAAHHHNIPYTCISAVVRGVRQNAAGFTWEYVK